MSVSVRRGTPRRGYSTHSIRILDPPCQLEELVEFQDDVGLAHALAGALHDSGRDRGNTVSAVGPVVGSLDDGLVDRTGEVHALLVLRLEDEVERPGAVGDVPLVLGAAQLQALGVAPLVADVLTDGPLVVGALRL